MRLNPCHVYNLLSICLLYNSFLSPATAKKKCFRCILQIISTGLIFPEYRNLINIFWRITRMSIKLFYALLCTTVISGAASATGPQYAKFDSGTARRTNSCACCPAPVQPVANCLWDLIQSCFGSAQQTSPQPAPPQGPMMRSEAANSCLRALAENQRRAIHQREELGEPGPQAAHLYAALMTEMDLLQKELEVLPSPTGEALSKIRGSLNGLSGRLSSVKMYWKQ